MTTKTEKRLSDIEGILQKLVEERQKPSRIRQLWNWGKPHIIPFTFGVIVGMLSAAVCGLPSAVNTPQPVIGQKTTLEQQAATGGAAVPFPIVSTQFFLELVFVVLGNFDKMGGMIFPSTFPTNG